MKTKVINYYPQTGAETVLAWTSRGELRLHSYDGITNTDLEGHFAKKTAQTWLENRGFELKVKGVKNFFSRKDGRKVCRLHLA